MSTDFVTIDLRPEMFGAAETVLARSGGVTASTFRYSTGVLGLRIANADGVISLLPFQGQQIWDAHFHGRQLAMQTNFDEPFPTQDYLRTYGAFFIHCGVATMGRPGPGETHALHGELPNATYQTAQLVIGSDGGGPFMALTGAYRHVEAFGHYYRAEPAVRLGATGGRIQADLRIRNLRQVPMEMMYLAHVNFSNVDGGVLVDTVPDDKMRVRALPPEFEPSPEYRKLSDALERDPSGHRRMAPSQVIDPEIVLVLDSLADTDGWAHSLQLHPDGSGDFISHRPEELNHGLRWVCRNSDMNALGLMLPATAEADGYSAEKAKGNLRVLPALGEFTCHMEFGALTAQETARMQKHIAETMR